MTNVTMLYVHEVQHRTYDMKLHTAVIGEDPLVEIASQFNMRLYCPKERYASEQQLNRYRNALVSATRHSQFLSWCGPDATKVGTDLSILMAAVHGSATGLCGVASPMASHDDDAFDHERDGNDLVGVDDDDDVSRYVITEEHNAQKYRVAHSSRE